MSEPLFPVILGKLPDPDEPEFREMQQYESGVADEAAKATPGRHAEPWLNVLDAHEPANLLAIEYAFAHPELGPAISGRVLDLGAGTCWVSAKLSRLERVSEVVALDMSQRFLTTVGVRIIQAFQGDIAKIKFAASSFNRVPFDAASFDCVLLVAAIHHSLSPIKTLMESWRVLKPGGRLILLEHPSSIVGVEANREKALALIVQRNALSCPLQWASPGLLSPSVLPRAGMALACPPVSLLSPGRDGQILLQGITGRFGGEQHLQ